MLTFFFRLSCLEFVEMQEFLQEYKYSLYSKSITETANIHSKYTNNRDQRQKY